MKLIQKHFSLYLMFLPIFLYFCVFSFYPLIRGFIMSLQEFRVIGDRPFIGLENYKTVLADPMFWQTFKNTIIIGGGVLLVGFIAPIIVAVLLNEVLNMVFKRFVQTVIYLPHLFSWVVVGGIWIFMLSPDGGLVNSFLTAIGKERVHFLADLDYVRDIMVLSATWKDMGYNCIIYLAAIVAINPTLYEAARIDGAKRWHEIRYITIPQLIPTMKIVLLLNLMGILRIFDQIFIMRNPATANKVDVLMVYIYEKGILGFQMGVAAAASFIIILITLLLVLITRKVTKYDME
ncbi:ABC transporter permease subunit [Bacillus sp. FJAT-42315]|uniref:ABC transporter permease subunit n=1 Tax=Bacillus sp. FJAT-42315 TaxID=2014077 RepID=UPI000C24D142|nr:ABC transporter permease subunit [Bacillus sp. FJAT-42315]